MIRVEHLSKQFEDPDGEPVPAVIDATLACAAGKIYGLLGPNGAGKTTTLRCLATVLTPSGGRATIAGHDLLTDPEGVRRSIGFVSASTGIYQRLTPRETLKLFGALHGLQKEDLERRVEETLALFDVMSYADRPNDRLSTGMKQRVSLARAVVHDPPVIIMDEPTNGLDPIVTATVEDAVKSLAAAGKCVLLSTHMLAQADEICDRIGVIGHGRVLAEGTKEELCERTGTQSLRQAFFKLVKNDQTEIMAVGDARGRRRLMRMSIVKTVFLKECREMLRDRRSLAIMFGIPLLLYPLMTVLVASIGLAKTRQLAEHPVSVVVLNGREAPQLLDMMHDQESGIIVEHSKDPPADLAEGKIDAVVQIPPDEQADALAGKEQKPISIRLDRSRTTAVAAERKLDRLLDRYQKWVIAQRLAKHGLSASILSPVKREVDDIATGDQRLGKILSFTLPVLLLVTGMLGAFFPALNATTTERELGTLETLLVTPAGRMELLVAKGSFVLLCGLATAGLNMLSMALVLWRSLSAIQGAEHRAGVAVDQPDGASADIRRQRTHIDHIYDAGADHRFARPELPGGQRAGDAGDADSADLDGGGDRRAGAVAGVVGHSGCEYDADRSRGAHRASDCGAVHPGVCIVVPLCGTASEPCRARVHQRATRQSIVGAAVVRRIQAKQEQQQAPSHAGAG